MAPVNPMAANATSSGILRMSDGTTTINLLYLADGYAVEGWRQAIATYKGGGIWSQSALADGRRLVGKRFANSVERYPIPAATASSADAQARAMQDLLRLCEKASDYWKDSWRTEPVWIEVRADCETESRYATLHTAGLPELDDFFSFAYLQDAVMQDLVLVVEREHWQSTVPGTGDCMQISGSKTQDGPYYIVFNGNNSEVDCGSDAGLDNLADDAMTVEAWVRPTDDWGQTASGMNVIAEKGYDNNEGWIFRIRPGALRGLEVIIHCAVVGTYTASGENDFAPDGLWHHVAFTWNDATDTEPKLWIDGAEPVYAAITPRNGAIVADATRDLMIGNNAGTTMGFDGDIGWLRVSDSVRYTITFTPPVRCTLPAIDGNTVAQWIQEGTGTAIDNQEGTAARDGTGANITWETDCADTGATFGRTATCDDEVFIANKNNAAQLTHVIVEDGGAFGANLIGSALPYWLLPAGPAVNDAVYFGCDTVVSADNGPFSNLILDTGTAAVYAAGETMIWEYWNGGWVGLAQLQDNTAAAANQPFSNPGVVSVWFRAPSDWVTNDPATIGATGFWVRARCNTAGTPTRPSQQNRDVYTVTWPFVEIDSAQVGGDIAALMRLLLTQRSEGIPSNNFTSRVVCGLRSMVRGTEFSAYLNSAPAGLFGHQNPVGITVSFGTKTTVMALDPSTSVTGYRARYNPTLATEDMEMRVKYELDARIAAQYAGTFHGYVRAEQIGGAAGDFAVRVSTEFGAGLQDFVSDSAETYTTGIDMQLDVGRIILPPPAEVLADKLFELIINVEASSSNAAADLYFMDLVLIPVDEWAGDFIDSTQSGSIGSALNGDEIDIDSLLVPRTHIRASVTDGVTGYTNAIWLPISNGPAQVRNTADQWLWFLTSHYHDGGSGPRLICEYLDGHTVQSFKTQRYLGMRGAN